MESHNTIIMGDFNAHNPAWFSVTQDDHAAAPCEALMNQVDSSQLFLLNQDTPTRLPSQAAPSSPDLTLISPHLALDAVWTLLARLNSDHLPISISLDSMNTSMNRPTRTYINFRRADWDAYVADTEAATPTRALNPNHPSLPDLYNNISTAITTHSCITWIMKVQSTNLQKNPPKFWSLLRSFSGKSTRQAPNQPISHATADHIIALFFFPRFMRFFRYQRDPFCMSTY
ncbi:hypothetical protein HAZT_HAZT003633 [Hyalella azteca]|uniref:Endonuclease/exonuclease/phosphatase domain-containing protein n=1 Tax=Hyalella azteca TaxID=294128 RepID=A0A6A0GNW5_HYAAZ|nr:hypothetical protein HAZT_HAZT003633 [Hyalella azteca]